MIGKVDSRYMIAFGFFVVSASLFYMTRHLYQGMDFKTAVELRCFQSVAWRSCSCRSTPRLRPTSPPEKNNAVSGIVNLSRNMGGDIGIALVTTLIARRSQTIRRRCRRIRPGTTRRSPSSSRESRPAWSTRELLDRGDAEGDFIMYRQLQGQATTLAYLDTLKVLGFTVALMIPLLFLTRKANRAARPPRTDLGRTDGGRRG